MIKLNNFGGFLTDSSALKIGGGIAAVASTTLIQMTWRHANVLDRKHSRGDSMCFIMTLCTRATDIVPYAAPILRWQCLQICRNQWF